MALLFSLDLGPLSFRFYEGYAVVFGRSRFRPSGRHHLSVFGEPHPKSGLMEPHLTCDDPGVPSRRKKRVRFRYDPAVFMRIVGQLEERLARLALERQVRVQLEELEEQGWVATFIPDDVADAFVEPLKQAKHIDVSRSLAVQVFELGCRHLLPVTGLDALVDEAPADARRRCFSLFRADEDGELEHAFVGWRPDSGGARAWYLTPPGDLDLDAIRRVLVEVLPTGFYESLRIINAKLGLGLDPERINELLLEAKVRAA